MAGGVVGEPPVRHGWLRVVLAHRLGYAERCVIVAGDQAADLSGKTAGPLVLAAITGDTGSPNGQGRTLIFSMATEHRACGSLGPMPVAPLTAIQ